MATLIPHRASHLFARTVAIAVLILWIEGNRSVATAQQTNVGIEKRVPWTTSRFTGSPEAALPYITERVFPSLTFKQCLDITSAPGSDRLFVVEQAGKIFSFPNQLNVKSADLV